MRAASPMPSSSRRENAMVNGSSPVEQAALQTRIPPCRSGRIVLRRKSKWVASRRNDVKFVVSASSNAVSSRPCRVGNHVPVVFVEAREIPLADFLAEARLHQLLLPVSELNAASPESQFADLVEFGGRQDLTSGMGCQRAPPHRELIQPVRRPEWNRRRCRDVAKGFAQALDDDFLFSDQLIDQYAVISLRAFDHYQHAAGGILGAGFETESGMQPKNRQQRSAHENHFAAIRHRGQRFRGRPEHFLNGEDGDDVALIPDACHEAFDNGESQWQLEVNVVPMTGVRGDFDAAAQFYDLFADDVHAYAAPGNVGYLSAVEKPGSKMKLKTS